MKFAPQRGYVMLYALLMITVLVAFSALYYSTTRVEIWTTKYGRSNTESFYAAEGALNLRAEEVRQKFIGYNQPSGTTPSTSNGATPCVNNNNGSGDYICKTHNFGSHLVTSYIIPDSSNPYTATIPSGEKFSGLTAFEYAYTVHAESKNSTSGKLESIVELKFRSRNVPLYQFAYFYNKDLELSPGALMTISGRLHSNYNMYLNATTTNPNGLNLTGQVTAAGKIVRGRKSNSAPVCVNNSVQIQDPTTYQNFFGTCGSGSSRVNLDPNSFGPWNNNVVANFSPVGVPPVSSWAAGPGKAYWDKADLRLALMLNSSENADTTQSTTGIIVVSQSATTSSTKDATATTTLNSSTTCPGAISGRAIGVATWKSFWPNSAGVNMRVLDVDMQGLMNCLKNQNWFGWAGKSLADTSDGGIILHLTVIGPNSSTFNNYGVRLRNGAELKSTASGAPTIKGLTVATDQALWTMGNFNITNKKPLALITDYYFLHSNQWSDAVSTYSSRNVSATTTVNAAIVSGTGTTGAVEGVAGENGAAEIGFAGFEENFAGKTVAINGAIVSLHRLNTKLRPYQYGSPYYSAPTRNFTYDTSFNNPANLPPLAMQFIYLREELFIRDFEQ